MSGHDSKYFSTTKKGEIPELKEKLNSLYKSLERAYGCKLCIEPCTTRGEGFYYDAYYNDVTLNEAHFGLIQTQAQKAVAEKQPFERIEVSRAEALEMFAENKFKVEIINGLPEDKTITIYRCGPLVDLCHGPHIPNTSFVKAFACLKLRHHIGEEKQTVKAYREYMEFLSLILNVSRYDT